MTQPDASPAGWYPAAPGVERWYDGQQWTDAVRATQQPPPRIREAITKQPVRTSHGFHLIMSLLTCGLWAVFVWLPITIINSMSHKKVVTRYR